MWSCLLDCQVKLGALPMRYHCLVKVTIVFLTLRSDFLSRCFVKLPEQRSTADQLLKHLWLTKHPNTPGLHAQPEIHKLSVPEDKQQDGQCSDSLDSMQNQLICPVLQRPLHDAVILPPCGHSVSEEAIGTHNSSIRRCPLCQTATTSFTPNDTVRGLIGVVGNASLHGGSSGHFPSPAVSEPTELLQPSGLGAISIESVHC